MIFVTKNIGLANNLIGICRFNGWTEAVVLRIKSHMFDNYGDCVCGINANQIRYELTNENNFLYKNSILLLTCEENQIKNLLE